MAGAADNGLLAVAKRVHRGLHAGDTICIKRRGWADPMGANGDTQATSLGDGLQTRPYLLLHGVNVGIAVVAQVDSEVQ
ncbi:Uncharacterised protein [Mycobacterium tuberculosis]|nr:Uncharacterised protein [Mycobacterium tuberculosis]